VKPIEKLRKRVGYFLVTGIAVYLIVSVYLTVFPKSVLISKKITQYYEWFVLPGPFFREDRIRYVPHFNFSYKDQSGSWSEPMDEEKENFLKYHEGFFDYPDLKRSRYERFLARSVWNKTRSKKTTDLTKSREFKELHAYLKKNYFHDGIDSVELDYKWKDVRKDTTLLPGFHIVYKSY
jgi:hypothetical protein